jgi:hypothetical protein
MIAFTTDISINQPRQVIVNFFQNPEIWFRLNPEWEFRKLTCTNNDPAAFEFTLKVCYDRTEQDASYQGKIEKWPESAGLTLTLENEWPRHIQLQFKGLDGPDGTVQALVYEELGDTTIEPRQQTELVLWLKSTADYLEIASRRSWHWRAVHYLLNKVWIRLTPMGRRVVFLVIAFEVMGLVFLVGLLLLQRFL